MKKKYVLKPVSLLLLFIWLFSFGCSAKKTVNVVMKKLVVIIDSRRLSVAEG